ncbi:MAG TPA: HmuY family protein [Chitinophagaceae bacterium]|nr:HmuY family protein [Chitinophagaceae bacterium]
MISAAAIFTACKKDKDPIIVIPPSEGSTITINGLVASEAGSSAGNSVYIDLSADKQTAIERKSWDLKFYNGNEFRVKLNNTTSAGAKVLSKTDLAAVGSADTAGLTLAVSQMAPAPEHYAFFDALNGSLSGTVIPEISATASENKVVIINRGTGGGVAARPWIKIKITRNGSNGYTLQYGELNATTFQTLNITKNADYLFQLVSFDNGILTSGEPEKNNWDFVWSYSLYETNFGGTMVPYNFSDLIFINKLAGVTAGVVLTSAVTYETYSKDNVATTTFSNEYNVIGHKWRVTSPSSEFPGAPVGVLTDRFFVVKDAAGNVYKLRFLNFHANDGGERGKPKIEYKLVQ